MEKMGTAIDADDNPKEITGTIMAIRLNLRDAPEGNILLVLERGEQVSILSREAAWVKVIARGIQGFVSARYVRVSGTK